MIGVVLVEAEVDVLLCDLPLHSRLITENYYACEIVPLHDVVHRCLNPVLLIMAIRGNVDMQCNDVHVTKFRAYIGRALDV